MRVDLWSGNDPDLEDDMDREHPCQAMLTLEHGDEIVFQDGLLTIVEPGEGGQYIEIQLPPSAIESLTRQVGRAR